MDTMDSKLLHAIHCMNITTPSIYTVTTFKYVEGGPDRKARR